MAISLKKVTEDTIKELKDIVGKENVLTDPADLIIFARDKSMTPKSQWYTHKPDVIVLPSTTAEVQQIVLLANKEKIPITARGAGTTFTGNAVPSYGGISIDMKKMNKIIEIDEENLIVHVQAGISSQTLDRELRKRGLMYPNETTSFPSATVGGNISTSNMSYNNSKYGDALDILIGLEVVLPTGVIHKFGGGGGFKLTKSSVGYPLRYLFVGHWGTLGIITEAALRVYPVPEKVALREIGFDSLEQAFKTARKLYKTGISQFALLAVNDNCRMQVEKRVFDPSMEVDRALLSYALMGTKEEVEAVEPRILSICSEMGGKDLGDKSEYYETRFDMDTAWPALGQLMGPGPGNWQCDEYAFLSTDGPAMFAKYHSILKKYGIKPEEIFAIEFFSLFPKPTISCMYRIDELDNERFKKYNAATREMADEVLKVGGSVSVCHGLGMRRLDDYVQKELGYGFELMKQIKKIFDPNNIMNPGKMGLDTAYK